MPDKLEPVGLPVPLKAWKARTPEPLVTVHCGQAGCGAEVGAVYTSPQGPVVESRMHPQADDPGDGTGEGPGDDREPPPVAPDEVAGLGQELGIVGMADEFTTPGTRGAWLTPPVRAQIDLLRSELYWQDPVPTCPRHGALHVERAGLADVVRDGQTRYDAPPR